MQSLTAFTALQYPGHTTTPRKAPCIVTSSPPFKGLPHCQTKSSIFSKRASFTLRTSAKDEVIVTEEPVASVVTEEVAKIIDEGPKTPVKFELQKECQFGERFNVIGNHPIFGEWNIEAAIPMEWSEGNLWSVEVDVPIGQKFEFKYILTSPEAEVVWQPGPNRVFETIECTTPLVITEPWESLEAEPDVIGTETDAPVVETPVESDQDGLLVPADINVNASVKEDIKDVNGNAGPTTGIMESIKEKVEEVKEEVVEAIREEVHEPAKVKTM